MTTRFIEAGHMIARVLGMPDYNFAIIDHPVSSATDDELRAKAHATAEQAKTLLLNA